MRGFVFVVRKIVDFRHPGRLGGSSFSFFALSSSFSPHASSTNLFNEIISELQNARKGACSGVLSTVKGNGDLKVNGILVRITLATRVGAIVAAVCLSTTASSLRTATTGRGHLGGFIARSSFTAR